MQYEIRAYDALYDRDTGRLAYFDVCAGRKGEIAKCREDAVYEFIDFVRPGDPDYETVLKTPYQYGMEYGQEQLDNEACRFTLSEFMHYFGGRRDYIVCITRQDFSKNGALIGEQCVGRCDVTITPAGVALTVIDTKEERYESVD